MTQCARVLRMLEAAGKCGVRSDEFIKAYMPRGAARIRDLRDEGRQIDSQREGKYVRYILVSDGAGVGTVGLGPGQAVARADSADSGVEADSASPPAFAPPDSLFDFSQTSSAYRQMQDAA